MCQFLFQLHSRRMTVALPLNSSGMYRGVIKSDGIPLTAIFDDDELA